MKQPWFWCVLGVSPCLLWIGSLLSPAPAARSEPRTEPHRSPIAVAVLPGGRHALSANHTADSVSLIDLVDGKVLAEQPCGRKPSAVAASRDGRRVAVSNLWSSTVSLLQCDGNSLKSVATVPVGALPRGLVFAPDGNSLYVALSAGHEVVQLDWQTQQVNRRWAAPGEPRRLVLSRDGRVLAAASARSAQVRCWDTTTGKPLWERTISDAFNLHGLAFGPGDKDLVVAHIHDRHHAINKHNIEEGWALDNRLSRLTIEPDKRTEYFQIGLDLRGKAVGDPCAVAFNTRGDWLVVAGAGTHELLLIQAAVVPWSTGDPGDLIDASLALDNGKLRRLPLGGRPLDVQFIEDTDQLVVANYLLDAIQVVDVKAGKVARTIALGGPAEPSLARKGEAIFYDAGRSHHQWFSCNSCHPDGHTSGRTFDTLNDDSFGNPKLTPSLRGVTKTGPWTWHGWQTDLGKSIEKSLTDTLYGAKPSPDDVQAVLAFLEALDHPPSPYRQPDGSLTAAAERGKALFHGKAKCARCHGGEHYTSTKNYDVKLEEDNSPYKLWNPPTLRSVFDRGPFLHDGRAESLDEVLRDDHAPQKLGAAELTPDERRDLIEFLKSL
jgi:cytochrome c peroxidase